MLLKAVLLLLCVIVGTHPTATHKNKQWHDVELAEEDFDDAEGELGQSPWLELAQHNQASASCRCGCVGDSCTLCLGTTPGKLVQMASIWRSQKFKGHVWFVRIAYQVPLALEVGQLRFL